MSSIFSGKSGRDAAVVQDGILQGARDAGEASLATGLSTATDLYGQAGAKLDPYASAGLSSLGMYQNSLGLNGATGNAAATSAFQTNPGYQFQMDQGLGALRRTAASNGMLGSGNLSADTIKYSQGLANQSYGNWQNNLSGLTNTGLSASGTQANILTGLGQLNEQNAAARASLQQHYGDLAGPNAAQGMMAGQTANANVWNAGMQGLNTLASLAGKAMGAGM